MLPRILLICFLLVPALSQAKQLSQTFDVQYQNFKIIKSYDKFSKKGLISIKSCISCPERKLEIIEKTILAENGIEKPLEELLKIKLSNSAKHILVQANKYTQEIFYIEWGYPKGEEEGSE
jgi:t-SNARE complex subunit (syntaxin)